MLDNERKFNCMLEAIVLKIYPNIKMQPQTSAKLSTYGLLTTELWLIIGFSNTKVLIGIGLHSDSLTSVPASLLPFLFEG